MADELPLHDDDRRAEPTLLEPASTEARAALERAMESDDRRTALREVAARWPTYLEAWARLSEESLATGDPVAAYAFARTGYHRGLDLVRAAGWRGQGPVPSSHVPNQGFLRSVRALGLAAEAIDEQSESRRCRAFLAELDDDGPFGGR